MKYDYIELGDCLELIKKLPNKSVNCILTDPPYLYLKNQKLDRPFNEDEYFKEVARVLKDDGFIVMFGRGTSFYRWNTKLANLGFEFKEEIIWNKRRPSNIFGNLMRMHETISIHTKNGNIKAVKVPYIEIKEYDLKGIIQDVKRIKSALNNSKSLDAIIYYLENKVVDLNREKKLKHGVCIGKAKGGDRSAETMRAVNDGLKEKSIIEVQKDHYKMQHPTQKPVRLLERLINLTTNENDIVLDTFMGSGSTCIACINTNRHYIGYEIDDEYFNIANNRINEAQNKELTLFDNIEVAL